MSERDPNSPEPWQPQQWEPRDWESSLNDSSLDDGQGQSDAAGQTSPNPFSREGSKPEDALGSDPNNAAPTSSPEPSAQPPTDLSNTGYAASSGSAPGYPAPTDSAPGYPNSTGSASGYSGSSSSAPGYPASSGSAPAGDGQNQWQTYPPADPYAANPAQQPDPYANQPQQPNYDSGQAGYNQTGYNQTGYDNPTPGYPQTPGYPSNQGGYPSNQGSYPSSPGYGANPYDVNPYQASYGMQSPYGVPAMQHPKATTAMVLGLVGLLVCPPVGIAGLVMGRGARQEIDANPQQYTGRGMATAGFVLGIIACVYSVLWILFVIIGVAGGWDS